MTITQQPDKGFPYALSECVGMKLTFTESEVLKQPRRRANIRIELPATATTADGTVFIIAGIKFTKQSTGTSNYNTIVYGAGATSLDIATAIETAINANAYFTGRVTISYVSGSPSYINIRINDYKVLSNFNTSTPFTLDTVNTYNAIGYELFDGLKVIWNLYNGSNVKLSSKDEYAVIYRNATSGNFECFIDFRNAVKMFLGLTIQNQLACLSSALIDSEFNAKFKVKFSVIRDAIGGCGIEYVNNGETSVFEVGNSIIDSLGTLDYSSYLFTNNAEVVDTKLIKFLTIRPQDVAVCNSSCQSAFVYLNAMTKRTGGVAVVYKLNRYEYDASGVLLSSNVNETISVSDGVLQLPIQFLNTSAAYMTVNISCTIYDNTDLLIANVLLNRVITETIRFYHANCDCQKEMYFMNRLGGMETIQFSQYNEIDNEISLTNVTTLQQCSDSVANKLFKTGTRPSQISGRRLYRYTTTLYQKKDSHILFMDSFTTSPFIIGVDSFGIRRRFTLTSTRTNLQSTNNAGDGRALTEFTIEGYFNDNLLVSNFNY